MFWRGLHKTIEYGLDLVTFLCDQTLMRVKQTKWVKFLVAIFVTLSLAFLPMLSEQAMAGHHSNGTTDIVQVSLTSGQGHAFAKSGSCEETSKSQSGKMQLNCCDMSCSSFVAFATADIIVVNSQIADYFEVDAEQLTSRTSFGFMRPPRT